MKTSNNFVNKFEILGELNSLKNTTFLIHHKRK